MLLQLNSGPSAGLRLSAAGAPVHPAAGRRAAGLAGAGPSCSRQLAAAAGRRPARAGRGAGRLAGVRRAPAGCGLYRAAACVAPDVGTGPLRLMWTDVD